MAVVLAWSWCAAYAAPARALDGSCSVFEETVVAYHQAAAECQRPKRWPVLRERQARDLARAIIAAQERVWPWEEDRRLYLLAVKLTETDVAGGDPDSGRREHTHGRWCQTVDEVRDACAALGMACPRPAWAVIERMNGDAAFDALTAAQTIATYEHRAGGDRVRGLMNFKCGARKVRELERAHPGEALAARGPWKAVQARYQQIVCVQMTAAGVRCSCLP